MRRAALAVLATIVLPGPLRAEDGGLASVQRGYAVYAQVCSACHSMRSVTYADLSGIGLTPAQVRAVASAVSVPDGMGPNNKPKRRPGRPDDHLPIPFATPEAAARANNGAVPPDMSRLALTLAGGPAEIEAILNGYADPPPGVSVPPGSYYNRAAPGGVIAMPPPLQDGAVTFAGGQTETVPQMAADVAAFLDWAARPHHAERTRIGVGVVLYLGFLAALLFFLKRRIWINAKQRR
ncbi:cytochrome c1 [Acetobacteraceae bacterium KSS8]|uniref:Cytochrome c1 n=1 Tax=Endosaccharibacter trunci TaxID=2812733 RepID=A0ABT1W300_9PROT|nr:cytochrome c1 [Acetobacteraceae bacterium KSS8]